MPSISKLLALTVSMALSLATAVPRSGDTSIHIYQKFLDASSSFNSKSSPISIKGKPSSDNSRIKNHPDKYLLYRINGYFYAFTAGDKEAMDSMWAENYTMTDIRKNPNTFCLLFPSLDSTLTIFFLQLSVPSGPQDQPGTISTVTLRRCSMTFRLQPYSPWKCYPGLILHLRACGQLQIEGSSPSRSDATPSRGIEAWRFFGYGKYRCALVG